MIRKIKGINTDQYEHGPFIVPDESYLIFESNRSGVGGSIDLYICFKQADGSWLPPKNMGNYDICCFSAKIIEELRPKE